MKRWEALRDEGPVLDPKAEKKVALIRNTKREIIDTLNYYFCSSHYKSRRICEGCYEINFYEDLSDTWSGEIRVQTVEEHNWPPSLFEDDD